MYVQLMSVSDDFILSSWDNQTEPTFVDDIFLIKVLRLFRDEMVLQMVSDRRRDTISVKFLPGTLTNNGAGKYFMGSINKDLVLYFVPVTAPQGLEMFDEFRCSVEYPHTGRTVKNQTSYTREEMEKFEQEEKDSRLMNVPF